MTAQLATAAAARLAYASAIQFEQDCAIGALEEQGANMLLDPDFTELLIPHYDGTYPVSRTAESKLNMALTRALKNRLQGKQVVLGGFLTASGFRAVRIEFRDGASQNLTSDEKAFLWEALTNLSVGAGGQNFHVSVCARNRSWSVSPLSRQWMTEAFGD